MKSLIFSILFFAVSSNASWLAPEDIRKDLKPADYQNSNMSEAEFQQRIKTLQDLYAPIVARHGGKLSISGDWKGEKPNAAASQRLGSWQVKTTGGLARRPELTGDGFSLILCHELGHHLGGFSIAPAQGPMERPWASNEGQSDYFSTQVCARKLWAPDFATNAEFRKIVSEKAQKKCDSVWVNTADQDLCYRILTAVESMIKTMSTLMNKPMPDFETPDLTVVPETSHKHPPVQCRMDTTTQGALCQAVFNESLIPGKSVPGGINSLEAEQEAATFSCAAFSGFNIGLRPTCWFKPRL